MQQRLPLLVVTGALAFGGIAYFLFLFDDGTMPTKASVQHPLNVGTRRHTGAGANSAASSAGMPPMMSPPVPIATTPAPADTGPPE